MVIHSITLCLVDYMKYHEKIRIETIVLILATLVLGSRELMHPFFHAHDTKVSCCYKTCDDYGYESLSIESLEGQVDEEIYYSHTCPLCSGLSGKYASLNSTVYSLPGKDSGKYLFLYSKISFRFNLEETSRGPPLS